VRVKNEDEFLLGKSRLEVLLKCKVLHYTCVIKNVSRHCIQSESLCRGCHWCHEMWGQIREIVDVWHWGKRCVKGGCRRNRWWQPVITKFREKGEIAEDHILELQGPACLIVFHTWISRSWHIQWMLSVLAYLMNAICAVAGVYSTVGSHAPCERDMRCLCT